MRNKKTWKNEMKSKKKYQKRIMENKKNRNEFPINKN